MAELVTSPPRTIGACVTLACLWEATAAKPGNVYRGADFEDLTYVDFLTSAAVVGPALERASQRGVGESVLEAVQLTRAAVATNTNLGMLLLLAPLATVSREKSLSEGIGEVLTSFSDEDTQRVFEAIRVANPGGLGEVNEADVNHSAPPEVSLLEAMQLAADRDLVARQYVNNFEQVFWLADRLAESVRDGMPIADAIVYSFLRLLAEFPDSLIARKCGEQIALEVSTQAAAVLGHGEPGDLAYEESLAEFDFSLRIDGHRRNPGTSADLIAAALFVLLRDERLDWPVRFYGTEEN